MRNLAIASLFAIVFALALSAETRAQPPYFPQSNPTQAGDYSNSWTSGGIKTYEVGLYHYGTSVYWSLAMPPWSTYYYLQEEEVTYKWNGSTWDTVIAPHSGNIRFNNNDYLSPHLSLTLIRDADLRVAFGTGYYKQQLNIYAYDPIQGLSTFIVSKWVVFTVYP